MRIPEGAGARCGPCTELVVGDAQHMDSLVGPLTLKFDRPHCTTLKSTGQFF